MLATIQFSINYKQIKKPEKKKKQKTKNKKNKRLVFPSFLASCSFPINIMHGKVTTY